MTPVRLHIRPDYSDGFGFNWDVDPTFNKPFPWVFTILMAPSPSGDWTELSPSLVNVFSWQSPGMPKINKSPVLYFKVRMHSDKYYESDVVQPYGDLSKKEFLLGKDIMRREVLHARGLAGVPSKVLLKSQWGVRCQVCTDPITGRVRDSNCPACLGTGYVRPYHGPYELWPLYTADNNHQQAQTPTQGNIEPKAFSVRTVSCPVIKQNDVVIDTRSNKRYYVSAVQSACEIRRIPIIQNLNLAEAPVTDPIYKIKID